MRCRTALLALLFLLATPAGATTPGVDIVVEVKRISEFELTREQTRILDEATKLSAACRTFHAFYERWPKNIQEIESRTSGIDFSVFQGKVDIDAVPEGLVITIFDSIEVRRLLATAEAPATEDARAAAQDPAFKIRVSMRPPSSDGA